MTPTCTVYRLRQQPARAYKQRLLFGIHVFCLFLWLIAANLGVSLVPASAMPLRTEGVIYRPLSDDGDAIMVETALVWHRKSLSPVVEGFLAVAREFLAYQCK